MKLDWQRGLQLGIGNFFLHLFIGRTTPGRFRFFRPIIVRRGVQLYANDVPEPRVQDGNGSVLLDIRPK